jgi:hypothetical protein
VEGTVSGYGLVIADAPGPGIRMPPAHALIRATVPGDLLAAVPLP